MLTLLRSSSTSAEAADGSPSNLSGGFRCVGEDDGGGSVRTGPLNGQYEGE